MSDITNEEYGRLSKKGTKSDDETLSVLRSRMKTAIDATSGSRNNQLDDLKFYAGNSDNNWQWPEAALATRTNPGGGASRPTLTMNMLPQHVKQVTNDQRQNRPAGEVIPVDGNADIDVSELYDGMVRHVEYISDADVAYDTACESQVIHGEGFWRILTDYADDESFDQDIFIKRIKNPFSVYLDPMIQSPCGEDAEWGFITEDLTHDEYHAKFKNASPISTLKDLGVGDNSRGDWIGADTIRIVEYFYYETSKATLNLYSDGSTAFEGTPKAEKLTAQFGEPIRTREADRKKVCWIKTNGYEILDEKEWPGKYIPIVRVVGNEFEVDGQQFVTGIVRNAKDPQRMYNYWVSQEAEMLALAPKAPFVGYGGQFEGYEQQWSTANTENWPYLQVNPDATDGNGNPLPLPQRAMPPMAQQGIIAAKQGAAEDIKSTTGQYNASLGMGSNERSGKAILARQHEGDVGTYHYGDNLARAVRYSTRQIVDLIPKIYDTERIARIIGEDGKTKMVKINPEQPTAVQHVQDEQGNVIAKIYNPSVGRYDVRVATGPGYATKRQQALDAMTQLLEANPALWQVAGDLFVKNMDWPGAQELSKRFAKTIDPKLMQDDDENPALQQAKQQLQQLDQELQKAHQMLQNINHSFEAQELAIKRAEVQVKMYDAETKRIAATSAAMTPDQVQDVVQGTIDAAVHTGDLIGNVPEIPPVQEPQQQQVPPMERAMIAPPPEQPQEPPSPAPMEAQ